jgi:type I restriction enzyme M protein
VLKLKDGRADQLATALDKLVPQAPWREDAKFFAALQAQLSWKVAAGLVKTIRAALGVRDEKAVPVLDPEGQQLPDSELREFENIPLKDDIDAYFAREVKPHLPDAWMDRSKDKIGYEISFTKYFYEYTPLRSTEEIAAELLKLDEETENLLREVVRA